MNTSITSLASGSPSNASAIWFQASRSRCRPSTTAGVSITRSSRRVLSGTRSGPWSTRAGIGRRAAEARLSREAADPAVGKRLWAAAEELTGVSYR